MVRFGTAMPTYIKVYVLLSYFYKILLGNVVNNTDYAHLGHLGLPLMLALFVVLTASLPSLVFKLDLSTVRFFSHFAIAWMGCLLAVSRLLFWYPNSAMLSGLFLASHLLYSVERDLVGLASRKLYLGASFRRLFQASILLLPWTLEAFPGRIYPDKQELIFIAFSPELLGMGLDMAFSFLDTAMST